MLQGKPQGKASIVLSVHLNKVMLGSTGWGTPAASPPGLA